MSFLFKHKVNWKYAIGEVILIFLGITLAIAFDNWNESRKDEKLKQDYLLKLRSNLDQDIEDIATWIRITDLYTQEGEYLLAFLEGSAVDPDMHRLKRSLSLTQTGTPFPMNVATYNDLVSSGNMQLIKDLDFKGMLDNYYNNNAASLPIREANRRALWYDYAPELSKYMDPLLHRTMMIESIPWEYKGVADLSAFWVDWKAMRGSEDLVRYLKVSLTHRITMRINYSTDLERAKAIRQYMDDHWDKL